MHPLREWRNKQDPKMSLRALAAKAGTTQARLSQIELGDGLTAAMAESISAATNGGVTIAQLLYPNGVKEGAKMLG